MEFRESLPPLFQGRLCLELVLRVVKYRSIVGTQHEREFAARSTQWRENCSDICIRSSEEFLRDVADYGRKVKPERFQVIKASIVEAAKGVLAIDHWDLLKSMGKIKPYLSCLHVKARSQLREEYAKEGTSMERKSAIAEKLVCPLFKIEIEDGVEIDDNWFTVAIVSEVSAIAAGFGFSQLSKFEYRWQAQVNPIKVAKLFREMRRRHNANEVRTLQSYTMQMEPYTPRFWLFDFQVPSKYEVWDQAERQRMGVQAIHRSHIFQECVPVEQNVWLADQADFRVVQAIQFMLARNMVNLFAGVNYTVKQVKAELQFTRKVKQKAPEVFAKIWGGYKVLEDGDVSDWAPRDIEQQDDDEEDWYKSVGPGPDFVATRGLLQEAELVDFDIVVSEEGKFCKGEARQIPRKLPSSYIEQLLQVWSENFKVGGKWDSQRALLDPAIDSIPMKIFRTLLDKTETTRKLENVIFSRHQRARACQEVVTAFKERLFKEELVQQTDIGDGKVKKHKVV